MTSNRKQKGAGIHELYEAEGEPFAGSSPTLARDGKRQTDIRERMPAGPRLIDSNSAEVKFGFVVFDPAGREVEGSLGLREFSDGE